MPLMNQKNYALSAAATDLGLMGGMGDTVAVQLKTLEDERKKKIAGAGKAGLPSAFGDGVLGPATQLLYG
jgi:hypothetical protein